MYDKLRENTGKYLTLSDEEFNYYISLFEVKKFRKKEFLLTQGEVCHFEAYVLSGAVVGFHINENGYKAVLHLMFDDWWVADIYGLAVSQPSFLNFQALEATKVLYIRKDQKQKLYQKFPVFNKLYRLMGMVTIGAMQQRMISNLSHKADERYIGLIKKYPNLEERVPHYLIASYLGISAEFLSKIRRKIREEG